MDSELGGMCRERAWASEKQSTWPQNGHKTCRRRPTVLRKPPRPLGWADMYMYGCHNEHNDPTTPPVVSKMQNAPKRHKTQESETSCLFPELPSRRAHPSPRPGPNRASAARAKERGSVCCLKYSDAAQCTDIMLTLLLLLLLLRCDQPPALLIASSRHPLPPPHRKPLARTARRPWRCERSVVPWGGQC